MEERIGEVFRQRIIGGGFFIADLLYFILKQRAAGKRQQEQPEVQLRSAGLDELRFADDETEENAEN